MLKLNKRTKCAAIIVSLLILLAMFLRIMWQYLLSNNLRGIIYIGLFTAWGVSIRRRILQVQVCQYLTAISAWMVFWVIVRSVKFQFASSLHFVRYCWYLYYLPMLFIPLLVLLVALSLGKPDDFRLPKWVNFSFLISAALFMLVLSNDLHQLVFGFPNGFLHFENGEYTHRLGYYIVIVWVLLCAITAFVFIVIKCRVPYSKQHIYFPCIPLVMLFIYAVLYLTAWDFIHLIAGDMTVVICLLTAAAFELCIQCGLIQSNTYYTELFECSSIRSKIVDEDYNVLLSSTGAEAFSVDMMRRAQIVPVILGNGFRLCSAPIKKGYVVWSEDVSEMTEVIAELADNSEYLSTRRSILHKEVETRKKEQRLIEQNRLYNHLVNDNQDKYALFSELISQLEATNDADKEKMLTAKLAVVCTHIKRRGNLLFLSEKSEKINASELRFALEEWLSNLRLCKVKCSLYFSMDSFLSFSQIVSLYDAFQWILLYTLDTLHSLLVTAEDKNSEPCLLLNLSCEHDLSILSLPGVHISDEDDGEWVITIKIPQESAAV